MKKILFNFTKAILPMWIVECIFKPKLKGQLYDTELGHCPLCGSLTCKGDCEATY